MGLEDILAAIRADTDAEISDVLAHAAGEVSSIEAKATADGEKAAAVIIEAAEEAARREADQIVIRARSNVNHMLAAAVEAEYQLTLGQMREQLSEIRGTPRYRAVLRALLEEAVRRLPEATVVSVDPTDRSLVDELVRQRDGPTLDIEISGANTGGVTVSTDDGRSVRNTFETRVERADGILRSIAGRYLIDLEGP